MNTSLQVLQVVLTSEHTFARRLYFNNRRANELEIRFIFRKYEMLFEDEDLPFEEDCIRNPYSLKSWLRYIDFKSKAGIAANWIAVYLIYERALKQLPGSYKLWYSYLKLRRTHLKGKCISDSEYEEVNNVYDRALAYMSKVFDNNSSDY